MQYTTEFEIGEPVRVTGDALNDAAKSMLLKVHGFYADNTGQYYFLVPRDSPEIPTDGLYATKDQIVRD